MIRLCLLAVVLTLLALAEVESSPLHDLEERGLSNWYDLPIPPVPRHHHHRIWIFGKFRPQVPEEEGGQKDEVTPEVPDKEGGPEEIDEGTPEEPEKEGEPEEYDEGTPEPEEEEEESTDEPNEEVEEEEEPEKPVTKEPPVVRALRNVRSASNGLRAEIEEYAKEELRKIVERAESEGRDFSKVETRTITRKGVEFNIILTVTKKLSPDRKFYSLFRKYEIRSPLFSRMYSWWTSSPTFDLKG